MATKFFINPIKQKVGKWTYYSKQLDPVSIKKGEQFFYCDPTLFESLNSVKLGRAIYDIDSVNTEDGKCFLAEPVAEDFDGMAVYELSIPIKIKSFKEKTEIMLETDVALIDKSAYKTVPLSRCDKQRQLMYMQDVAERSGKADVDMSAVDIIKVDEVKNRVIEIKNSLIKRLVDLLVNIDLGFKVDDEGHTFLEVFNSYLKEVKPSLILKDANDYIGLAKALSDSEIGILAEEEQELRLRLTIENIKNDRKPEEYEKDIESAIMIDKFRKSFDTEEAFQEYVKAIQESVKAEQQPVVEEETKTPKKKK